METAGPNNTLNSPDVFFIVSDHGWSRYKYYLNVNRVLFDHGFITQGAPEENVSGLKPKKNVIDIARSVARLYGKKIVVEHYLGIDYLNSTAYMPPSRASWYYVIVRKKEYLSEVERVLKGTGLEILDPRTVFTGEKVDEAPGLIILWDEDRGVMAYSGSIYEPRMIRRKTANHGRYGILVYRKSTGAEWLERFSDESPSILPNHVVAPLVSHTIGLPISSVSDSLGLLKRYGGVDPRLYDYRPRWRLIKKIHSFSVG
jgi:hypothetical protein